MSESNDPKQLQLRIERAVMVGTYKAVIMLGLGLAVATTATVPIVIGVATGQWWFSLLVLLTFGLTATFLAMAYERGVPYAERPGNPESLHE